MELYGTRFNREELAERASNLSQVAGVQLSELQDGAERGMRCLEFRTGGGLTFQVLPDRGMDIGRCEYKGRSIGWESATGARHPYGVNLHEDGGFGLLRSFSGLLVTCGLDHTLFPIDDDVSNYDYPHRQTTHQPMHGRIAHLPAKLSSYGHRWDGDDCWLFCEGVVTQACMFGEHLELVRRIEARVGESKFRIKDIVTNRSFSKTPHMLAYHINVSYPILDNRTEFVAPIKELSWASHADSIDAQGVGYRFQSSPSKTFVEQVYEHRVVADSNGRVPVALINDEIDDGNGMAFSVEFDKRVMPCLFEWQSFRSGSYAFGIEPSTNHVMGKPYAREHGELTFLDPGESRTYETAFGVSEGAAQIDSIRTKIRGIQEQPERDISVPSDRFEKLS